MDQALPLLICRHASRQNTVYINKININKKQVVKLCALESGYCRNSQLLKYRGYMSGECSAINRASISCALLPRMRNEEMRKSGWKDCKSQNNCENVSCLALVFWLSETRSRCVDKAILKPNLFQLSPGRVSNAQSHCFSFLNAGITGM